MFSSDQPLVANQLPISVDFPRDQTQFIDMITLLYKRIANSLNTKEGAVYLLQELATFQQFFTINDPQRLRNGYRTTFDLVDLNGGPIPPGVTVIVLTSTTQPPLINQVLIPVNGFGAGTIAGPIYVFNGTDFNVRFDNTIPAAQTVIITNNTGTNLTQLYWVFEYLKTS